MVWLATHRDQIPFCITVAASHVRSRKHEAGVSAITLVSIVGVTVGVTALIMVLAVMEGFEIDLRDKIAKLLTETEADREAGERGKGGVEAPAPPQD